MKNWSFKVASTPKEAILKLDTEKISKGGFAMNIRVSENRPIQFTLRKRIQYGDLLFYHNLVTVKGKISKSDKEDSSIVEVIFRQHFLVIFASVVLLGLTFCAFIYTVFSGTSLVLIGLLLLFLAIINWGAANRLFKRNIQKYKVLLADLFEVEEN